jgi:Arc/MetJ-type ribon-helix-helix transcriptional regulator
MGLNSSAIRSWPVRGHHHRRSQLVLDDTACPPDAHFRSTFCSTILVMPRTIQARLDEHAEEDLALLRNEGHNDSDAIRLALREAAARRRRKSALRLEAEAAASDPEDLSEAREVRAEMDALAAPWPES